MTTFKIRCSVTGGVTGAREAWAKENGKVLEFETYEEAERAAEVMRSRRREHSGPTSFFYSVFEID